MFCLFAFSYLFLLDFPFKNYLLILSCLSGWSFEKEGNLSRPFCSVAGWPAINFGNVS